MRILLDENVPRKLVAALRAEGHDVESVHTLELQGLENGKLYEFARDRFDLLFTRDSGVAAAVRELSPSDRLKLVRLTLPQERQEEFVINFLPVFREAVWAEFKSGDDWP